jgi:hypothetical protein
MVIHKARLGEPELDFTPIRGEAAISLTTRLTIESFSLAGMANARHSGESLPVRFVPRSRPWSSSSTIFATFSSNSTCWRRFVVLGGYAVLEGCKIPVIGRGALIKNKRAAGRPQDVADVKALDNK